MPAIEQEAFNLSSFWLASDLFWAVLGVCNQLKPTAKRDQTWWQFGPWLAITVAKRSGDLDLFGKSGPWQIHCATSEKHNLAFPKTRIFVYFECIFRITFSNFTYFCFPFSADARVTAENHSETVKIHFAQANDHCMVCQKFWKVKARFELFSGFKGLIFSRRASPSPWQGG